MNCGKKMALYFESSRTLYEPENALELIRTKNSHFKGPKVGVRADLRRKF